jgi:alpha-ketoglutarate-dependent taurine dioxygenase
MTSAPAPRVPPFPPQPFALDAADYLIDCAAFDTQSRISDAVYRQWRERGLVILKNTGMTHLRELQRWAEILFDDFGAYTGGSAPRDRWSDKVFGLDDAPETIDLCFHNEGCYLPEYPRCFVIGSVACPRAGGFTLVADNEATTEVLAATPIGRALRARGVRYIRLMQDKTAADVLGYKSWQDTFYTDDRTVVEAAIRANGWDFDWLADGTLRTSHRVDAYEHDETLGKALFFAGPASHAAFFDQWPAYSHLTDDQRPLNMTLGDGTPFSNDDLAQIYAAYNRASLALDWRHVDLALLDNLRWAHARPAYRLADGEQRTMGVALGMMTKRRGLGRTSD